MNGAASHGDTEILIFAVGSQRYALPCSDVQELVRAVTVVPLPKAPAIIEGVIDVRGTVVAVLDIRQRFRLPPKSIAESDHLVLAWAGPRLVALRVDRAEALVRVAASDIESARRVVPDADYVAGVAKLADGLVLIHDIRTFLSAAEGAALDAAATARAET